MVTGNEHLGKEPIIGAQQAPGIAGGVAMKGMRLSDSLDVPAVFLHDVGDSYDDLSSITGIAQYAGRALGATLPGDVIHLPPELMQDYLVIKEHYETNGLPVAENVDWTMNAKPGLPGYTSSVFLFGEKAHQANPDERRLDAVTRFNDKNWFVEYAKAHGYPVPPTDTYTRGEVPQQTTGGPWFVKGAVAASGTQVIKCNTWEEVVRASDELDVNFQVQKGVNAITFLNVQYSATRGKSEFVATTEQELNGFAHDGNRHPSRFNPRHITDPLAAQAAEDGLEGVYAFDVAVLIGDDPEEHPERQESASGAQGQPAEGGQPDMVVIECNPRPNGSSYFTAVAERLGVTEWSGVNIPTGFSLEESIVRLADAGLIYDSRRGSGLIVVNWGTALEGKLGILFTGSGQAQQQHKNKARAALAKA